MLKPKLLIRIASGFIFFFAFGHTIGHFTRYDVTTPIEKVVLQVMTDNKFDLFGHITSYDGMYTGLSYDLIFPLLVFTILLWHISAICTDNKKLATKLLLPVTVCILGFSITGFLFFFPVPAITCLIASIILAFALIKLSEK